MYFYNIINLICTYAHLHIINSRCTSTSYGFWLSLSLVSSNSSYWIPRSIPRTTTLDLRTPPVIPPGRSFLWRRKLFPCSAHPIKRVNYFQQLHNLAMLLHEWSSIKTCPVIFFLTMFTDFFSFSFVWRKTRFSAIQNI